VDFAAMAESMGVPGRKVGSVAAFEEALDAGMAAPGPYLIDVDMERLDPMEISIMPKRRERE
jgi:acetolactate synthase-1/2/3 large subunit